MANPGFQDFYDGAADPLSPPATNYVRVYPKSGIFYKETSAGTISPIGSGLTGQIDVTQVGQYVVNPVLTTNAAATNNTNLAAIMAAAPSGSVLYFPGGFFSFASVIAIPGKVFTFQGANAGINGSLTGFQWTSNVAGDLITMTALNYYTTFRDILFTTSVAQTAGAVINVNNAYTDFYRCVFSGLSASNTLFNGINFNGTAGGTISIVEDCNFTSFTGTAIIGNNNNQTIVIHGTTINGGLTATTGAACGINVLLGGAVQIDNCDVIGCTNDLLINPITSTVVASVFVMNTYFDNAFGSCLKISGAGATVRCIFTGCSFTTATSAVGASAVEISTTVAAGAQGIDFIKCNILNTFATTGTTNGFLITGGADYAIQNCRIAGWTNGLNLTPHTTAGATIAQIQNNIIGISGGYGVNTVGILLNAGAAAYGALQISNNDCVGNTTPLTNNLTTNIPTNAGRYRITDNAGINPKGTVATPAFPTTTTVVTNTTGYRVTAYFKSGATAPTVVTINGVSTVLPLAAQIMSIPLDPGGTFANTFTVAGTWTWVAN